MARNEMKASLLRPALALLAMAGLLTLGGCGGGSGPPNNPFAPKPPTPGPVSVLPPTVTVYTNTPATLTISGGTPPYQAFSSNSTALPVTQAVTGSTVVLLPNNVSANTSTTITVQDAMGQTATATVTVSPAPIVSALTITPARTTCGANTVCSGDTAIAAVQVTAPGDVGVPNRQVKFDVVTGAFGLQTNNPAQPLASTVTVVTDANGNTRVVLQATVNAPTQSAQLRATDLTSGYSVTAAFTIVQQTDGTAILSIVPATATITGSLTTSCSAGFRIDYYIYGGTPPYRVSSTFPTAVTVSGAPVNVAGGNFTAITNGTCVNPLTFTIVDATGRQVTAQLINQPGTTAPPAPPTPTALTVTSGPLAAGSCSTGSVSFAVTGGTPPYNFSTTPSATLNPSSGLLSGPGGFTVSGLTASTTFVTIVDSGATQQSKVLTITCT